jgi:hypothetical protein
MLFMLDWLESPELRRRCHAGPNRSEQRHFLAQVICTFKQGRIADRSAEAQQFRASGLNLVIAAIVFWNSTYIATPSPISVRLNNRCLRTEQRILVGAPPDLRRSGRLGRSNVGGEQ